VPVGQLREKKSQAIKCKVIILSALLTEALVSSCNHTIQNWYTKLHPHSHTVLENLVCSLPSTVLFINSQQIKHPVAAAAVAACHEIGP